MREDISDENLMQRVAAGDHLAFRLLVERHAAKAHAVAQRLLFSASEADDLVQETCLKLWVHAPSWDAGRARFTTWFYRMLTNACIDYRRKKKPVALDDMIEVPDETDGIERHISEDQMAARVKHAVATLSEKQQVALALCYFEGFSNRMAAETMGIHIKALEGLLARARRELKDILQPLKQRGEI
jgi:RNA polymerase sigma-70 factor, ECF subfamily